jgi:hypothetical protein
VKVELLLPPLSELCAVPKCSNCRDPPDVNEGSPDLGVISALGLNPFHDVYRSAQIVKQVSGNGVSERRISLYSTGPCGRTMVSGKEDTRVAY